MKYEPVIGLEVHVHLATKSKLFCSCPTTFGADPNENVCEVCSGMPGVLPRLNEKAVEYAARLGMALGCTINNASIFARKNYFYPDLPKGYQISQFEKPICEGGHLTVTVDGKEKKIGITRIHMEDDAGKNIHSAAENASYVDLNRAGVPLVEIVSEPDMRSAEEAVAYLKALHAIVVHLGVSDGNMEEGSFRCDANVSIRPVGQEEFGTRTELKNLNSFRHVQKAIEYEIERQSDELDDGHAIIQETRLYDVNKGITASMRSKEEAQDYRYYPDPDLNPVHIDPVKLEEWRANLPELPEARLARMQAEGVPAEAAEQLIADPALTRLFDEAVAAWGNTPDHCKKIANLILGPLMRVLNQDAKPLSAYAFTAASLAELAKLIEGGTISSKIAADIFSDLMNSGESPEAYVKAKGLAQVSDSSAIDDAVKAVIEANPAEVEAYRGGKTKLISFFVGQVMREMRGKANPAMVNELLAKYL